LNVANSSGGSPWKVTFASQGRVTALLGDPKGAVALYKKALEKNPSMALREEINARLSLLEPQTASK